MIYVEPSLSRDQCFQASLNVVSNLLSKEETRDTVITEILGLNKKSENDEEEVKKEEETKKDIFSMFEKDILSIICERVYMKTSQNSL